MDYHTQENLLRISQDDRNKYFVRAYSSLSTDDTSNALRCLLSSAVEVEVEYGAEFSLEGSFCQENMY